MTEGVIINADDYAMDGSVDAAILELAAQGVVTATSAMVLSPTWPDGRGALGRRASLPRPSSRLHSPFAGDVFPRQSITGLTMRAHSGRPRPKALAKGHRPAAFAVRDDMKAPPDFVDGHQHCHLLPFVREALIDALADRYGAEARRISLRICTPRRWRGLKAAMIARTGTFRLESLATERAIG